MDIQSDNSLSLSIDDHKIIIIDADEGGYLKLDLKVDGASILQEPSAVTQAEARKIAMLFNGLISSRNAAIV